MGNMHGKEGKCIAVMLVIIKLHCENRTNIWFSENVTSFDRSVLTQNCGHVYRITEFFISPKECFCVGLGCAGLGWAGFGWAVPVSFGI